MQRNPGTRSDPSAEVDTRDESDFFSVVHRHLQMDDCLNAAVEAILSAFHASAVEILPLDESAAQRLPVVQKGFSSKSGGAATAQKIGSLAHRVTQSRQPVFLATLDSEKGMHSKNAFQAAAGVPILSPDGTGPDAVLGVYWKAPRAFAEREKKMLADAGQQISVALQNIVRYEGAVQKAQRLIAVSRAITVTRQLGTLDRILDDLTKMLVSALGFDASWIGLVLDDNSTIEGQSGFGTGFIGGAASRRFKAKGSDAHPFSDVIKHQKTEFYTKIRSMPEGEARSWLSALGLASAGFVPISSGEKTLGVIGVFCAEGHPFHEEDGRMLSSVADQAAVAIENTRLYERVKRSEEQYRTLFESVGACLAIVDDQGLFRLVNRAFETLSGFSSKDLVGKRAIFDFFAMNDPAVSQADVKMARPPQRWEEAFHDREGGVKQVFVLTAAVPHSKDILVSMVDLTRERELERRLYESEELASLGELSAGIAHEIRNPLIAINTSVSILQDEKTLSHVGKQVLDVVKEETDHLAAIVNDFLRYARPKQLTLEPEDINKLVKDTVRRFREQCGETIVWIERYDETLPAVLLDRHQFQQVITNLLSNSVDAMPEGGRVFVETGINGKRRKVNQVLVAVRDTGIGIPKDIVSKIFQPFYSTKEKGTGMGLAICHRIISQHSGDIFVDSEPGHGATFTVALPVDTLSGHSHP